MVPANRNMMFATRESHSELHKALKLRRYHALVPHAWFVRAESLFNVATEIKNLRVGNSYGDNDRDTDRQRDSATCRKDRRSEGRGNSGSEKTVGDAKTDVGHFHENLFKLKSLMNTDAGQRMAEDREHFMQTFLNQYLKEENSAAEAH